MAKYTYDGRNRLNARIGAGITTTYGINGQGQRVRKTWNGTPPSTLTLVYADARKHIGTYDPTGANVEETIFLVDTNTTNQILWDWTQADPFARTLPNQNSAGLGTFNWRRGFPGQFYDTEKSGWHNGFRDYHPALGRYLQSEPIGLSGGDFSTFGYAGQSPAFYTDPLGLIIKVWGSSRFKGDYDIAIRYLMQSPMFANLYKSVYNSPIPYNVYENIDHNVSNGCEASYDEKGVLHKYISWASRGA